MVAHGESNLVTCTRAKQCSAAACKVCRMYKTVGDPAGSCLGIEPHIMGFEANELLVLLEQAETQLVMMDL